MGLPLFAAFAVSVALAADDLVLAPAEGVTADQVATAEDFVKVGTFTLEGRTLTLACHGQYRDLKCTVRESQRVVYRAMHAQPAEDGGVVIHLVPPGTRGERPERTGQGAGPDGKKLQVPAGLLHAGRPQREEDGTPPQGNRQPPAQGETPEEGTE